MKSPVNKVVFAVSSRGNDFYSAMTRVSLASLRVSNPGIQLVVACDAKSNVLIREVNDELIDEVDEWLTVDTPSGSDGFRNRYLKTQLRSLIDGPFLFLDSDVFVRGDLSEIFQLDCDVAGARNHSRPVLAEQIWSQDAAILNTMGWNIDENVYVNGGVFFFNDTEAARTFAAEWHKLWLDSTTGQTHYRDQPALNAALFKSKPRLTVLPDCFNAQFVTQLSVAADAVIWHYYSSADIPIMTSFQEMIRKVLNGEAIDLGEIRKMSECEHPWRADNFIDTWVVKNLHRRGSLDGWEAAWLARDTPKFVLNRIARALKNVRQRLRSSHY